MACGLPLLLLALTGALTVALAGASAGQGKAARDAAQALQDRRMLLGDLKFSHKELAARRRRLAVAGVNGPQLARFFLTYLRTTSRPTATTPGSWREQVRKHSTSGTLYVRGRGYCQRGHRGDTQGTALCNIQESRRLCTLEPFSPGRRAQSASSCFCGFAPGFNDTLGTILGKFPVTVLVPRNDVMPLSASTAKYMDQRLGFLIMAEVGAQHHQLCKGRGQGMHPVSMLKFFGAPALCL